jgi:regulatory protein
MISKAYSYLLKILSIKDYSLIEVQEKLNLKGFDTEEIEQAINLGLEKKFINDERMAENLVICYLSKKGQGWVKNKLKSRKISNETIQKVMSTYQEDQLSDIFINNLKKTLGIKYKIADWKVLDMKVKQKIYMYLSSKGFANVGEIIGMLQS